MEKLSIVVLAAGNGTRMNDINTNNVALQCIGLSTTHNRKRHIHRNDDDDKNNHYDNDKNDDYDDDDDVCLPKVLREIASTPMLSYSLSAIENFIINDLTTNEFCKNVSIDISIVINNKLKNHPIYTSIFCDYQKRFVALSQNSPVSLREVIQEKQLGTGHAVFLAMTTNSIVLANEKYKKNSEYVLVLYGDVLLLNTDPIITAINEIAQHNNECSGALCCFYEKQKYKSLNGDIDGDGSVACNDHKYLHQKHRYKRGYGKCIVHNDGCITKIIEDDGNHQALYDNLDICNSGILLAKRDVLASFLSKSCEKAKTNDMDHNTSSRLYKMQEIYLTNFIEFVAKTGNFVRCVEVIHDYVLGINDRWQLAYAEQVIQNYLRSNAILNGATLIAPDTVFLSKDTIVDDGVIIHPYVCIGQNVILHKGAKIMQFSHIEYSVIGKNSIIGPFARLRGGKSTKIFNEKEQNTIGKKCKIGSFVEIKNVTMGNGVKAPHFTYIGDAIIGDDSNIGAGVVFCNYNGREKNRTDIGNNAFIGANVSIVAPIKIGNKTKIGAGSVITEDVPDNNLSISRAKQTNIQQKSNVTDIN